MHSEAGDALLGDFGAASFFAPGDVPLALALQRLEVRAFSCLLEELLARCSPPALVQEAREWQAARQMLADLQAACAQDNAAVRPLFADIEQRLASCRQGG